MKKQVLMVGVQPNPVRGYDVVVTNVSRQEIRPHVALPLDDALTEAQDWADFFGISLTAFVHNRQVVKVNRRGTYDGEVNLPTAEELANNFNYRLPTHELNWNKVIRWEWNRFGSTFKNKDLFRDWLLPYVIDGPIEREWLATNCVGLWMPITKAVRFTNERDATLYKLFYYGESNAKL